MKYLAVLSGMESHWVGSQCTGNIHVCTIRTFKADDDESAMKKATRFLTRDISHIDHLVAVDHVCDPSKLP